MEEVWKPIKGYENYYEVSNLGKVRGLRRLIKHKYGRPYMQEGKEKVPQKRSTGYLFVRLFKDGEGKSFNIHRLVAEAFIDNPNGYPVVNHKDESRTNNVVSNLEACSGFCERTNSEKWKAREGSVNFRLGNSSILARSASSCVKTFLRSMREIFSLRRFNADVGLVSGRKSAGPLSIPINKHASPGEICEAVLPK